VKVRYGTHVTGGWKGGWSGE